VPFGARIRQKLHRDRVRKPFHCSSRLNRSALGEKHATGGCLPVLEKTGSLDKTQASWKKQVA
jgi:hypothetical protein